MNIGPKRKRWLRVARMLGLPPSDYPPGRRGFVAVQIDGLGYYVLKDCLGRTYVPFLSQLIKRKSHTLMPFRSGLPATTPAAQLGIMFGDNDNVPGFRWVDKVGEDVCVSKSPDVCARIEKRIHEHHPGILENGSSYCNMFSGGAKESTLTLSRMSESHRNRLPFSSLLLLFFFVVLFALRVIGLSLLELVAELYDQLDALQRGERHRDEGAFPIIRVVTNVVFREVATFGTIVDLARGVPFIYLNFSGYDEVAHHRGPNSIYAKLLLAGIDDRIALIARAAQRFHSRPYDLFVLSDHGMSTTVPFEREFGQSVTEWLSEHIARAQLTAVRAVHRTKQVAKMLAFTTWLKEMQWSLPRSLGPMVRWLGARLEQRVPEEALGIDWSTLGEVFVAPTGSLLHMYFTRPTHPLCGDEIDAHHPNLTRALVQHPGVLIVTRRGEDDDIELHTKLGKLTVSAMGTETEGDPLRDVPDGKLLVPELVRLQKMRLAGDLVVYSARVPQGRVVNFQMEMGSHGGLHHEEQTAFLLAPAGLAIDPDSLVNVRSIYPLFRSYHDRA